MSNVEGALFSPQPQQIETCSGLFVDLLDPDPDTIVLEDIAQALSLTCRYGGHVSTFYSVAEHTCLVYDLLAYSGAPALDDPSRADDIRKAALFHDAPEAYLGDAIAPLKYALRNTQRDKMVSSYDVLESRMGQVIAEKWRFGYSLLEHPIVKTCDLWAMRLEARTLTKSGGAHWRWPGELPFGGHLPKGVDFVGGMTPAVAEYELNSRFRKEGLL